MHGILQPTPYTRERRREKRIRSHDLLTQVHRLVVTAAIIDCKDYLDEKSDALFPPPSPPPSMLDTQNTARTAVATRAPAFPARVRQLMIMPALSTPRKMDSIACAPRHVFWQEIS